MGAFRRTAAFAAMLGTCAGLLGCGAHFTAYYENGQGLTIVSLNRADRLEPQIWRSVSHGQYEAPRRIIRHTPKSIRAAWLAAGGPPETLTRRNALAGFYEISTQSVHYVAGDYRALKHEFCHHILTLNGVRSDKQEPTCHATY